jgi:hypothetical protein
VCSGTQQQIAQCGYQNEVRGGLFLFSRHVRMHRWQVFTMLTGAPQFKKQSKRIDSTLEVE